MVGLMMGDAGTVIEGTVREGIIRPMGTRDVVAIVPAESGKKEKQNSVMIHFTAFHIFCVVILGRI